jgi:hypothetical protein
MAGIKIIALPAAPSAQLTDVFPISQSGVTYKESNSQLLSLFQTNGQALTEVNDTNVTMTLGGSPTTALLNATSMTLGWAGQLAISRGGTGISAFGTGVQTALGQNVTGSGGIVLTTSPSLITPNIGVATGTSLTTSGNITAGLSAGGSAGALISYPPTTNEGKLTVAAVNNSSGNFNTTISNINAVGQSQTISIPDVGSATGQFILSDSTNLGQTIGGDLAITDGLLVIGQPSNSGQLNSLLTFASTTANKGTLNIEFFDNVGNFDTQISNESQGQATSFVIPDAGNANAQFLVAATTTPFVNGNLPKASGTKGVMVDSGISAASITTSGMTWSTVTTSQSAAVANGYIANSAGALTFTLPSTASIGSVVAVEGLGAGGWILTANAGQTIKIGGSTTSTAGSLTSANASDNVYVTCIVANTTWRVRSTNSVGLTIS